MSKLLKSLVIVALLAGVLVSCQGKRRVVYTPANLKSAVEGRIANTRYLIESPNVIGAFGRVAVVREGQTMVFFVGDSLETRLAKVKNKMKVGAFVQRITTPYIHFMVDFMIADAESVKVGEAAANLPALRDAGDFTTPDDYVMVAIDQLTSNRRTLKFIQNKNFLVIRGKIATTDTVDATGAKVEKFTVGLKTVKFVIDDTNEGVQAMLRAIMQEDSYFEGGLVYGTIPASREEREKHGIGGNVRIGFFKYMGKMVVLRFS
jgi:hypothetical protein